MEKIERVFQTIIIFFIKLYQIIISPLIGHHCRFSPSCSEYTKEAIQVHGIIIGGYLSIKRLLSCHPWHCGGYDPVPKLKKCEKI